MVIRKCHSFSSPRTFFVLFNAFVRSKLEYASVLWNGSGSCSSLSELDKIQKKFLRFVYYKKHGVYPHPLRNPVRTVSLLNEFSCQSLRDRRVMSDHLFLYKLLNGITDCPKGPRINYIEMRKTEIFIRLSFKYVLKITKIPKKGRKVNF